MNKSWQFLGDSKVLYGESGFTWIGTIAYEIRNMANQALREHQNENKRCK